MATDNILVSSYLTANMRAGTEKCTTAIINALAAAEGKTVHFDVPDGFSSFAYTVDGNNQFVVPKNCTVKGSPGAWIDARNWNSPSTRTVGYELFTATGTMGTEFTISMGVDSDTITETDPENIIEGGSRELAVDGTTLPGAGWYFLKSTEVFTLEEAGEIGQKGEWVYVTSSVLGAGGFVGKTIVTLLTPTVDQYNIVGATVKLIAASDLAEVKFLDLRMVGPGAINVAAGAPFDEGDSAIEVINGINCHVVGCDITGFDRSGIRFTNVAKPIIRDNMVTFPKNSTYRTQYGISLAGASFSGLVEGNTVIGGKESFCLTSTGMGGLSGITRGITFSKNVARGAWRSGFCTHDNHDDISFIGNTAENCVQGFDLRIKNVRAIGNRASVSGMSTGNGLDCGFNIASGAGNIYFSDNVIEGYLRGYWMSASLTHEAPPGDIVIEGGSFRSTRIGAQAIRLDFSGLPSAGATGISKDTILGRLKVYDIYVDVPGGSIPIRAQGAWQDVEVTGSVHGGTGGGAVVHLLATKINNVNGPGPSNARIEVTFPTTFNAPLVQQAVGIVSIQSRGAGSYAAGETFYKKVTWDIPSLAAGARTSTTKTVSGASVGDLVDVVSGSFNADVIIAGIISNANTVTIEATNRGATTIDLGNGDFHCYVRKAG
jgi:hypothetical protein